jgi:hypothetical protein
MPTAARPTAARARRGEICRVIRAIALPVLYVSLEMCALFVMRPGCPAGQVAAVGRPARLLPRMADRLADRPAPDLVDWAIAAVCFAAFTVPVLLGAGPPHPHGPEAVFGAIAAAPLIVRRRWPVTVVLVIAAVYVTAALADAAFTPFVSNAGPNLAIAVFTAADLSRRRWSLAAAGVAGAATWASLPVAIHLHPHHDQDAVQLAAVIAAWLAGDMVRALRGYRRQLQLVQRRRAAEELQPVRA